METSDTSPEEESPDVTLSEDEEQDETNVEDVESSDPQQEDVNSSSAEREGAVGGTGSGNESQAQTQPSQNGPDRRR